MLLCAFQVHASMNATHWQTKVPNFKLLNPSVHFPSQIYGLQRRSNSTSRIHFFLLFFFQHSLVVGVRSRSAAERWCSCGPGRLTYELHVDFSLTGWVDVGSATHSFSSAKSQERHLQISGQASELPRLTPKGNARVSDVQT